MYNKGKNSWKNTKGISLIVLVITIIVIIILATAVIVTLMQNSPIKNAKEAANANDIKVAQESFIMWMSKRWIDVPDEAGAMYSGEITKEKSAVSVVKKEDKTGKVDIMLASLDENITVASDDIKSEITLTLADLGLDNLDKIIINQNVVTSVTKGDTTIEKGDTFEFDYETKSRIENNVEISIKLRDITNGIKQIDMPDGTIKEVADEKDKYVSFEYIVEIGKEYKFNITTLNNKKIEKTIKVEEYYYNISKNLGDGIKLENSATKTAFNKPYSTKIIESENFAIDNIEVTMDGKSLTVDKDTGTIEIDSVTGDIQINVTSKNITPLNECLVDNWNFSNSLESSVLKDGKKEKFVVYKGSGLSYEEEGLHLESTIITTENNYKLPSKFTVIFRYKPTQINTWTLVLGKITHYAKWTSYNGIFLRNNMNQGILCNGTSSDVYFKIPDILEVGKFSTLAMVYDGKNCMLYRDGKLVTKRSSYYDLNSKLFVGGSMYSGSNTAGYKWGYANGYFKDLNIYNRPLSITELRNY